MIRPLDRDDAVKQIADHLADRDRYVITVPPNVIEPLAHALGLLTTWTAYVDHGQPFVLQTSDADALFIAGTLTFSAAVVTVPKTVSPATLTKVFGQEVPADGSQDVVILCQGGGKPIYWPMIFVDALEAVDPQAARLLRTHHLPNLS